MKSPLQQVLRQKHFRLHSAFGFKGAIWRNWRRRALGLRERRRREQAEGDNKVFD
jgi:hypothetical protein